MSDENKADLKVKVIKDNDKDDKKKEIKDKVVETSHTGILLIRPMD